MCTTCGCGAGETRIDGKPVPAEHAGDPNWHVHADGTGHSHDHAGEHVGGHTHEHGGDHAHAHTHVHQHPDGTVHAHPHDHSGEHHHHHHAAYHEHEHTHADGSVHVHGHTHDDTHFHDHPQAHDHVHAAGFGHSHEHQHVHVHEHADGSIHAHAHDHSGEHHHHHHSAEHEHPHSHADGTVHAHGHSHVDTRFHDHPSAHEHVHGGAAATLDYGNGPARAHAPGMTQARMVQIERDILSKNDGYARQNRQAFADRGILALNFVSSPGSGKTTLLCRTIEAFKAKHSIAVIEGDQQTANDADRIRATGAPALQINTGKGCHLDASMVGQAFDKLAPQDESLLFIENVGNLVCPAAFDLGEAAKVAILSVTEGEDKPLKYPDMFAAASLMLLNKIDLLPHLSFKVELAIEAARRVNPGLEVIQVSATSGEGFDAWLAWLEAGLARAKAAREASLTALRRRVAELEAQLAAR